MPIGRGGLPLWSSLYVAFFGSSNLSVVQLSVVYQGKALPVKKVNKYITIELVWACSRLKQWDIVMGHSASVLGRECSVLQHSAQ